MKTKNLRAPFVMFCTVATLVGCASTDRRGSTTSLKEQNLPRAEAPASPALPQPAVLDENAFLQLDLNADGAITLDEWQHFDTSAGAKENFNALDENGDGQIKLDEFLKEASKHPKHFQFLGAATADNDKHPFDADRFGEKTIGSQPGWTLFSFHF